MKNLGAGAATADYLQWLGTRIPLVEQDLKAKAKAMAADPLRFLRGSYYLWLLRAAQEIPEALAAPLAVAVGDAHVENFGVWIDGEGQRIWGVNDFDEVGLAPYCLDLIRTVASAIVSAPLAAGLRLDASALSRLVIEGWAQGLEDTSAFRLGGQAHPHLSALVPAVDSTRFWQRLEQAPAAAEVPPAAAALVAQAGLHEPEWRLRVAGTGSLGHRRVVAMGQLGGSRAALEVKELGPPTADWPPLDGITAGWRETSGPAWAAVSRMPGFPPGWQRHDGWSRRRLGPESGRIELAAMDRRRDETALVRSMGRALGAVHAAGGRGLAEARQHCEHWGPRGLEEASRAMADRIVHDFRHS